ncbi:MAG: ThuA domain-containing protein [Puniceicoccales bacterium]|jgi:type 1 glutamine amidotransferase|nr:ThuA domain-containing protein [Puniceicoccales bacterium]
MKFFKSLLTLALFGGAAVGASAAEGDSFNVLVFSKTNGFRHGDAIAVGQPFFKKQGELHGFKVELSEDPSLFTPEKLKKYQAIVLLNTTGAFLADKPRQQAPEERRAAFENWVKEGGAIVGLHSATDSFWEGQGNWPEFHKIIGGSFQHHPHHQVSILKIVDKKHPTVAHLKGATLKSRSEPVFEYPRDDAWVCFDEWYNFKNLQRDNHIILQVEDSTCRGARPSVFTGGEKSPVHPFAWTREYGKGKIFYTSRGHYGRAFAEPDYAQHVIAGLFTVLGKPVPKVDPESLPKIPQPKRRR